jgi:shikimate dehydrogenase
MNIQPITGATRLVALLGDPVAHSISPQIHNHLFRYFELPYAYIPLQVKSPDLQTAVAAIRASRFLGANVTIPHKQHIINYCDAISPLASQIGAVNTLYFKNNLLCGTTTDPEGFFRAIRWMGHDLTGGRVIILGNGGTARTLGFALALEKKIASLTIAGRNSDKVLALANEISNQTGIKVIATTLDHGHLKKALDGCTLLINCTSVGLHPNTDASPVPEDLLMKDLTVFDTIYNPSQTRLLAVAEKAGCLIQNGLRMLVYQGLASFKYWTGIDVDESAIDLRDVQKQLEVK